VIGDRGGREKARELEHWDDGGSPDGLSGDETPLGARIIAVCDAYDAMTSNRPSRTAMSAEVAVATLTANGGTQFDPTHVDALRDVFEAGTVPPNPVLAAA
jgi:HD-GYP domain-containing protein (c-di-GMP phosphodiesterase class II)